MTPSKIERDLIREDNCSAEAMNFVESMKYVISELISARKALQQFEKDSEKEFRLTGMPIPDLIVPSSLAPPPIRQANVAKAADIAFNLRLSSEGHPYDEALIEQYQLETKEKARFRASKWSKLFPILRLDDVKISKARYLK